ncbi:MAG: PDDEXK nuclease domain-containing protein [Coxiellaceae bacterium]|nr:PDDEXK nuclease domain-containing protein [Coxiellaceae bacterium]
MDSDLVSNKLCEEISRLIDGAKRQVAQQVNSSLVILYWKIGERINKEILFEKRAGYGRKIVKQLAERLYKNYGRGFNARSLFRMVRFVKQFPDEKILMKLSALLSWSHFVELIVFDDVLECQFYTELCRLEHWSVRELRKKIDGQLYRRTAISNAPRELIKEELSSLHASDKFTQDLVFRDPYILDFLNLPVNFSEKTLEEAILDDLCQFLQEIGTDFCFIGRQKRIIIDNEDYYIDLLTYHRGLSRLVAIELKLGRFTASHKGQVELYLKWLDKYERRPGENKPLGLVLCANKNKEHVELLELDKSGIHVAQYLTELPEQKVLQDKLRFALASAKENLSNLKKVESNEKILS